MHAHRFWKFWCSAQKWLGHVQRHVSYSCLSPNTPLAISDRLDYAGPEILRGERYFGKEQDVWAFGVVTYVLLVGECPFVTPEEAQEGVASPTAKASIALETRCGGEHERKGEEADGGGALKDAATLVRTCLQVEMERRPTFDKILECRFLAGDGGW
jgi:protein-serine/threonine kinase